jgi:hypothetical protein
MAAKKRPCRHCRRWFAPDARVGDRQRTCSREECQKARRAATQASWRARHPEYDQARRIQERAAAEAAGEVVTLSRAPRPLDRLPWDFAQDQFKVEGAEFLLGFGRLLRQYTQDQIAAQVPATAGESRVLPVGVRACGN